ncbi:protein PML isoform X3 [Loxodonta africana]|uniref:protein PML isoform X3 n=1 Tax=Loxodonta africana TaxID=9785 RepID=UPI0030D4EC67
MVGNGFGSSESGIETALGSMQQEPAPARSPGPQEDPALPDSPTMPPPGSPSEGHQSSLSPSRSSNPTEQIAEEEFQFLRCQDCKAEAKCPKLLPCLHTLCSGCLEVAGVQCPICQTPRSPGANAPALDNVFFESLQRRLSIYRQIVSVCAACTRCKEPADFWCFECEQLICTKCFEAHQWFVKHEARPLADLRGQSVHEFLDCSRRSNNIFCSNSKHHTPELTSIYCRGCCKPLCCSCALLDTGHTELKCDIHAEIQQRQEELAAMTHALQEQESAFGAAHAQIRSALCQLDRARADTEELIRARVLQVVAHVKAREEELLESLKARYRSDSEEMTSRLGHLDGVLQRIRMGGALVERMKRYASEQEVLDMHGFLREALHRLRQEEPQSLQAPVPTDGFNEFKVRLQDLISCTTEGTDAALPKRASPEAARTPRNSFDVDLPEEAQRAQAQVLGLSEAQPVAVVQQEPGAHPVPVYAFSIKDTSYGEEDSSPPRSQKRKSCQTEGPRKIIKMESEEEKEARLAQSFPEQPRPSTSKAVSPPRLDGSPSPESPVVGNEALLPNSNHVTSEPGEAEERIVVISSSEDSDGEDSVSGPAVRPRTPASPHSRPQGAQPQQPVEPTEMAAPPSSPAHPLLRARGAPCPSRASRRPRHKCCPTAWPPHHPAEQADAPEAQPPSLLAGHEEHVTTIHRGICFPVHRAQRGSCLRQPWGFPFRVYCAPVWTPAVLAAPATTPATSGPPNHSALSQEAPTLLQRASCQSRRARGGRPRGRSYRGSQITQWINHFFSLPVSSVASQFGASAGGAEEGGRVPQILGAGVLLRDSNRTPVEDPQV